MRKIICCLLGSFSIVVAAVAVVAEQKPAAKAPVQHELVTEMVVEPVLYRGYVKQALASHLYSMGLIATMRSPHQAHMPMHAQSVLALAKVQGDLYAPGSETPATAAAIWEKPESFAAALADFEAKAAALARAVEVGNRHYTLNMINDLREGCESCHDQYRAGTP